MRPTRSISRLATFSVIAFLALMPSTVHPKNSGTPVSCPVNPVVSMPVPTPSEPGAYSFDPGSFDYIVSSDGRIAVSAALLPLRVGGNKFGFSKPNGSISTVTGRRIDGDAPPLGVDQLPPEAYSLNFEVMGITFPSAGCWEISISAGGSELRFYVVVSDTAKRTEPSCQ